MVGNVTRAETGPATLRFPDPSWHDTCPPGAGRCKYCRDVPCRADQEPSRFCVLRCPGFRTWWAAKGCESYVNTEKDHGYENHRAGDHD